MPDLLTTLFLSILLSSTNAATFPPPSGPFNTTLSSHQLTDYTRLDPYSPIPTPRSLMISIFRPSKCTASQTPYMDPQTASWTDTQFAQYGIPAGLFATLNLLTCHPSTPPQNPQAPPQQPKPHLHHEELRSKNTKKLDTPPFPTVLFSPGLGNPRLWYTVLAQQISSHGYTVVTLDHPYDAGIVVYPDGTAVLGANISTDAQITFALSVRSADVSFVLDALSYPFVSLIPDWEEGEIDNGTDAVGIFGHSLGGATAAQAMLEDERIKGAVNLDGSFFGPLSSPNTLQSQYSSPSLSNPFLLFAHTSKNLTTDASWSTTWPKLHGWKRLLQLTGSAHATFTDLSYVVDVLGLRGELPAVVGELLGTIEGGRVMAVRVDDNPSKLRIAGLRMFDAVKISF